MALFQGINQGIQQGTAIANSILDRARQAKLDKERQKQVELDRSIQAAGLRRQARQDQIEEGKNQLSLAGQLDSEIANSARNALQSGGFQSAEEADAYAQKKAQADKLKSGGRNAIAGYDLERQRGGQIFSDLSSGSKQVEDIPGDQLGNAFVTTFGHSLPELIDSPNSPSPVSAAVAQFHQAIQSGDTKAALGPINVLLKPEIDHGVGQKLDNGDTIVDKKISQILPHPDDPTHAVIGLDVTAQKPDGSTYTYHAPLTQNRSGDPNDPVLNFSITKGLDRISKLAELTATVNDPQNAPIFQQKAQEWQQSGEADRLAPLRADYLARGGDPKALYPHVDYIDAGDRLIPKDPRTGEAKQGQGEVKKGTLQKPLTGTAGIYQDLLSKNYSPEQAAALSRGSSELRNPNLIRPTSASAPGDLIDKDTISFMAKQALAGDSSVFTNIGRGSQGANNLRLLRQEIAKQAAEQGIDGADLAAQNADYFGSKAGSRTLGTRSANVELAANEAANLIPLARQASADFPRSEFVPIAKAQQLIANGSNDPRLRRLVAANNAVVNAYARAISPTGVPTVADKEHAYSVINTAYDDRSYNAVLDQFEQEINAARQSPEQVRKGLRSAITGKKEEPSGKQSGIVVVDPNGGKHTFPDQASADKFKKLAGIK